MADAGAGRHDAEIVERVLAPAQETIALAVAFEFEVLVLRGASGVAKTSIWTEWSITRSTGTSGFTFAGSPPSRMMPSRIAARSTTAGTPVKSCIRMRAGLNGTSFVELALLQPADDGFRIIDGVAAAVLEPQHVLQQHFQADRQAGEIAERLRRFGQREVVVVLPPTVSVRRVFRVSCPIDVMAVPSVARRS